MYLSRLYLDPRCAKARRDLADPYQMHRTLSRAFLLDDESVGRFLWRLEPILSGQKPMLLVQSGFTARWEVLEEKDNYFSGKIETRKIEIESKLKMGESFRFRLHANPTVGRNGRRYALMSEDQQTAWLERQAERHGFSVGTLLVTDSSRVKGRKGENTIQLQRVAFEGYLSVQKPDIFLQALLNGIGPGKAFGCGLLSIALQRLSHVAPH